MLFHAVFGVISLLAGVTKSDAQPRYDPSTVVDLQVVVMEVHAAGENDAVQLVVRTEANTDLDVYLGPSSFLKDFEIAFSKGDQIQIIGSKIKLAKGSLMLAREVRKGSSTLYLRSRDGEPYWH
jgi:hypothetical protein